MRRLPGLERNWGVLPTEAPQGVLPCIRASSLTPRAPENQSPKRLLPLRAPGRITTGEIAANLCPWAPDVRRAAMGVSDALSLI